MHRNTIRLIKYKNLSQETCVRETAKVVREIMECRYLASSSSLHGLIFADSFLIPNVHLKFSDHFTNGFHKFEDHYFGMGTESEHLLFTSTSEIEDIVAGCRLRYTEESLYQRQEEMKKNINSVIFKRG